ncbi:MAG TPA: hypothetical protein VGQ20_14345 [Acidimicrobiales bacterium]|jgi:hypothetical protein|nr:hypothetical protein [Acidimicrobiales bacterium]
MAEPGASTKPEHTGPDDIGVETPVADALEQHRTVTDAPSEFPTHIPPDVPEADALEQSRGVPIDDEDAFDEYEPDRP